MKYIKYFEGISLLRINRNLECEELKDFCEEGLCFLIDDGFDIRVTPNTREDKYDIHINKPEYSFTYEDICDQLIPFIKRLNKEYLFRDPFKGIHYTQALNKNNIIAIYTRQHNGNKRGYQYEIKDILSDDKSIKDIRNLYDVVLSDVKISVIPRKWNRHIHTGSLMDIQYPNN